MKGVSDKRKSWAKKPHRVSWRISSESKETLDAFQKRHNLDTEGEAIDKVLRILTGLEIERNNAISRIRELAKRWDVSFEEFTRE